MSRAVPQQLDAGAVLVPPDDADLLHGDVEMPCQGDDLDVPGEAVLVAVGQDLLPQRDGRGLGSALGVGDARDDGELYQAVVGATQHLAPAPLPAGELDATVPREPIASTGARRAASINTKSSLSGVDKSTSQNAATPNAAVTRPASIAAPLPAVRSTDELDALAAPLRE